MLNAIPLHPVVTEVTQKITERSKASRARYLADMTAARSAEPPRKHLSCGNLAHAMAACDQTDKDLLAVGRAKNVGIVTAFNDMLSAHQPYQHYPDQLKAQARELGGSAQVAGGVPAMCDGVTQGRGGMELSLFSRDLIAMSAAVAMSHDVFDAGLYLGVCDKIVPGLVIGALRFGHLPAVFVPAGPMSTGLSNSEKVRVRQLFAEGKADRDALLAAESASYHSAGTCTFYGTANSNQMVLEVMGLQLPGSSFVPPSGGLRDALSRAAVTAAFETAPAMGELADEKAFVNAIVALLASGGSTNHTLHLMAMAAAAGVKLLWDDFAKLSAVVPLLCRIYPNGTADVNHFHAAGGTAVLIGNLLDAGLLHEEVNTVAGFGLNHYRATPKLEGDKVVWDTSLTASLDEDIIRTAAEPFSANGGLQLLTGNVGRSVIKVSAVAPERQKISAPAKVFHSQQALKDAFAAGELEQDFIAVLSFQGPKAKGMPELHELTPVLGVLQDRGFKVALVTDGRMSGASGKVPAAIHMSPEALDGGNIAKIRDGDMIHLDCIAGSLLVDGEEWLEREVQMPEIAQQGYGRELFSGFRSLVSEAEKGGSFFNLGE
ncbi:phosphogluconate dehydratase [uncultured Umboniibacter sp.]|uniref:phosphogluconate dehydratase n=1 Tax=uncultured Umboniibacter sp. TaxID=1798917 RepID=UPI002624B322|nr:phosphogluconate dehydratase [uncultured Umboniibacter sp.]